MYGTRRLWFGLGAVLLGTFLVLGWFGREVYRQAPPIPDRVVTQSGEQLATGEQILDGQQVWQSVGGQQVGSIWGHGAYQAPDWSADWLHREATALLSVWARAEGAASFDDLAPERQVVLRDRVQQELRENTYDPATGTLTISDDRATAIAEVSAHYESLFGADASLAQLREDYALHRAAIPDGARRTDLARFFFWTAWACTTERPGSEVTYTNNWPHEPLVGNAPTAANVMWSMISIVVLLAGIGALVWYHAAKRKEEDDPEPPRRDPLDALKPTPSMRAAGKYCLTAVALFVVQVLLGAVTAHYTVEGDAFFGFPLADYLPYAITRTWHLQLAVFWIATSFLAAGLFLAPAIGGKEPRFQRLGVNVLFGALVLVVVGSLTGEWMAVQQKLGPDATFWFGHQGYEYVDLGRAFQIALFGGLAIWLTLMLRALWPALTAKTSMRPVITLFTGSTIAIGLFYGAGFFFGARSHLSVMEYWRWWVVHLWVEGFFEVFATAAVAFLFAQFGLVTPRSAARASIFATSIFLLGGIPGTFHHLYFSGTPVSIMAVGASFSALEVVPLVLIGKEALDTLRMEHRSPWMRRYRWPLRFLGGVAFWNLVGAGIFGFLINPPIALYYMQGLNTTPVHGHAALFGVYGLLSLALILLVLRRLRPEHAWNEKWLSRSFWLMNTGLAAMIAFSLLPIGLIQAYASMDTGLWYARGSELMQQGFMENLRWARIIGDTLFLAGVASFGWFVTGLFTGHSLDRRRVPDDMDLDQLVLPSSEVAGEREPVHV